MADKKDDKKAESKEFSGKALVPLNIGKRSYKIGDVVTVKDQDSLDWLKKNNKVK